MRPTRYQLRYHRLLEKTFVSAKSGISIRMLDHDQLGARALAVCIRSALPNGNLKIDNVTTEWQR